MKRSLVLFACLLAISTPAQDRVELNIVSKVEVKGGTVEITCSKKPSFTTFSVGAPPRLVIDISEAKFAGVPEQIKGAGQVSAVKTQTYGNASASIARVAIDADALP